MHPAIYVALIIVIIYVIYYVIQYVLLPVGPGRIGPEQLSLSSVTTVISSAELNKSWNTTSGSTLVFYINPLINDRTVQSGNEYATALQIGSHKFKLLVAPDAGRGYSMAPAQLELVLSGSSGSGSGSCPPSGSPGSSSGSSQPRETIDILNIPLQRWTAVAIVKQGRRIYIYVNGRLSISHTCASMPVADSTAALKIGDPRLGGSIALMSLAAYPMRPDEIRSLVQNTVDTSGKPYLSSGIWEYLPIPNIFHWPNMNFMCPGGNCSSTVNQIGPLEQWSVTYT